MNIKKYRANTTREALEKIKNDLGEDAFVLETKQVRTKGFLGFGSERQIEVSATTHDSLAGDASDAKVNRSEPKLNLSDESEASPSSVQIVDNASQGNLQTMVDDSTQKVRFHFPKSNQNNFRNAGREIDAVEISSKAPRVVHSKTETTKQLLSEPAKAAPQKPSEQAPLVSNRELELLRAELREVKFSLGAFAARRDASNFSDVDLSEHGEIFDSPFYDSYLELSATGIKPSYVREHLAEVIMPFKDGLIKKERILETVLLNTLSSKIVFEEDPLKLAKPAILALIGSTGVGKTTTIAKLAARVALHENKRVELVTLDTYRIAAVAQLQTYADIIGAGCHVVRSVLELDAVLRRMPEDATILIDTIGKNPHDLADQYEISDYLQSRRDIRKCLAIDATTNPIDSVAMINKFAMYGTDCVALTKLDETIRPGSLIENISECDLPLVYLCMGQRVPEDLRSASVENLASQILRKDFTNELLAA